MKLTDEELLAAVARLYARIDPAPTDLADGVLARLACQDLESEYEMLTLVERIDTAAGVRGGSDSFVTDDQAAVTLEFAGSSYRVMVRISTVDDQRRIDGWLIPAVPMRIFLGTHGDQVTHARQETDVDTAGRFEFAAPASGETRLWLLPQGDHEASRNVPPFVTPPFLV